MKALLGIIFAALFCTILIYGFLENQKTAKLEQDFRDFKNRKDVKIKLDSLRDAIELSVRDSINVQLVPLKNEIVDLKTQLKKESQANEDLYKKIDALRVAMPEF
jgi:chromosome segregation ATPase